MSTKRLLLIVPLLAACGSGGVRGLYTNRDGSFVCDFERDGKVEVSMGNLQQELKYDIVDGKVRIWDAADEARPNFDKGEAHPLSAKGCFDAGLMGTVCPKSSWRS